jgi:hypothetical protein
MIPFISIYPEDARVDVEITSYGSVNYEVEGGMTGQFQDPCDGRDVVDELKKNHPKAQFYVNDRRSSYDRKVRMVQGGKGIKVGETSTGHIVEIDVHGLCQAIKDDSQYNSWNVKPLIDTIANVSSASGDDTLAQSLASKLAYNPTFTSLLLSDVHFVDRLIEAIRERKIKKAEEAQSKGLPPPPEDPEPKTLEDRWDEIA